ncbi:MAG: xanthine dehydrogenase family protein subunit M [Burkholderiaceae bacterium]|nr:xanthine dehydrogenase family protein subunit M [Burkholderiaceae bacterium]
MSAVTQRYDAPDTIEEAVRLMAGGTVSVLAGGTDLMPQSRAGRVTLAPTLLSLRRIAQMRGLSDEGDSLRIGATTTLAALARDPLAKTQLPLLVEAIDHFASAQIRNAATIGGNVCNASPAGDMIGPLLVLDASVELVAFRDGALVSRRVALEEFFTGPGRTVRAPDELLVAIHVPKPAPGAFARFHKFGVRPALDISAIAISIAGAIRDGVLHDVRVAFGALGPTPLRGRATEAALEGHALDEATIAKAARAAREEVHPISDVRASAWYRAEMVENMTRRLLQDVR